IVLRKECCPSMVVIYGDTKNLEFSRLIF
ncbi:uncharacterized protein METZ01_LOCUS439603, partial [marine metagenome]